MIKSSHPGKIQYKAGKKLRKTRSTEDKRQAVTVPWKTQRDSVVWRIGREFMVAIGTKTRTRTKTRTVTVTGTVVLYQH